MAALLAASSALGQSPIADWHVNEDVWTGAANEVRDSSSSAFHGRAMSGATAPAFYGHFENPLGCASVNAAPCQHVDFGNRNLGLDSGAVVTVMAWVQWGISPQAGTPWANVVVNQSNRTMDAGQFWLQHSGDSTSTRNEFFEWAVQTRSSGSGGGRRYVFSTTRPAVGTWYHVAGVYDGRSGARQIRIYVNGVLEGTASLSQNIQTHSADNRLQVGQWPYNQGGAVGNRGFNGDIDEVRIFRAALTQQQIQEQMNIFGRRRPVAVNDTITVASDSVDNEIDVLANDTIQPGPGPTLTVQSVGTATFGTASSGPPVRYTPVPGYAGLDAFPYVIADGLGNTATATVTVTVLDRTPPNTTIVTGPPPVTDLADAVFDFAASEPSTFECRLDGAADFSACGDPETFVSLSDGAHVLAVRAVDGSGNRDSSPATWAWEVDAASDPPTAQNDAAATLEDESVDVDVLANDLTTDPTEAVELASVGPATNGYTSLVTVAGVTQVRYLPAPDFFGIDSFDYEISDSRGDTAIATVSVTVLELNDPPTALDDEFSVAQDSQANLLVLLDNDSAAPDLGVGETIAVGAVGAAANGTVLLQGEVVTYTPDPGYAGLDVFDYMLIDGRGGAVTATVMIRVEDRTAPSVVAFTESLSPHPYSEASFVTVVTAGVEVFAHLRASEPLALGTTLILSGPETLEFAASSVASNEALWSFALPETPAPGTYSASVRMRDAAGNEQTAPVPLSAPGFVADVRVQSPCLIRDTGGTPLCSDFDGDGSPGWSSACSDTWFDCDDTNPAVFPGAPEIPGDGLDNGCMGIADPAIDEAIGVFAAPWGSASNPGTRAAPLSSLRAALAAAASTNRVVFLAHGSWGDDGAPLEINRPVIGGLDALWRRNPLTQSTVSLSSSTTIRTELLVGVDLQLGGAAGLTTISDDQVWWNTMIDSTIRGGGGSVVMAAGATRFVRVDIEGPTLRLAGSLIMIHGRIGGPLVQESTSVSQLVRVEVVGPVSGQGTHTAARSVFYGSISVDDAVLRHSHCSYLGSGPAALTMTGGAAILTNGLFGTAGVGLQHDAGTVTVLRANLFGGTCAVQRDAECQTVCGAGGNLCAAPAFLAPGDYHLAPGSPGVNTGIGNDGTIASPSVVDLDGSCNSGSPDMGADEVR